ncbi:MAG TPA: PRC-barrel domain-containing protein [Chloroflexota bacterium]|nr:PRC-barrel domain-containing protein [Chloroflexota bacterium]
MAHGFATQVHARDGQVIGAIDRLILDPAGNKVKAAVIRKGRFLRRDVEVPLNLLSRSASGDLHLDLNSGEVSQLPLFDEAAYTSPPTGYIAPAGYPGENFYLPRSVGDASANPSVPVRADDRPAALPAARPPRGVFSRETCEQARVREGSLVLGRDGTGVGHVRDICFDPESGRLTALFVRVDSWPNKEYELAVPLIAGLHDGIVRLKVNARHLLP